MSDILVLQWSRLGDLLQTRILLNRLRVHRPDARIVISHDHRLSSIAARLGDGVEPWPLDLRRMAALAGHSSTHRQLLGELAVWISSCDVRHWDVIFVLSNAMPAVIVAASLGSPEVRGFSWNSGKVKTPPDILSIERARQSGIIQPHHLADVWASWSNLPVIPEWPAPLTGTEVPHRAFSSEWKVMLLSEAGEAYRSLPHEWSALLVDELLTQQEIRITLTGQSVRPTNDLLAQATERHQRVRDLRGRTTLAELCDLMRECDLVVGPDTGALHLAAAMNVPVIGLYFAGAHCAQTGPYTRDAFVFQDRDWSESLAAEVALAARYRLEQGSFPASGMNGTFVPSLDEQGIVFSGNDRPVLPNARSASHAV